MHIVGNGASNGHHLGAGGYRQNPATRDHQPLDVSKQHARLTDQSAGTVVESDEMVEPGRDPERAFRIQADIAVTASHAVGHARIRPAADQVLDLGRIVKADDAMRVSSEAPPGGDKSHRAPMRKT